MQHKTDVTVQPCILERCIEKDTTRCCDGLSTCSCYSTTQQNTANRKEDTAMVQGYVGHQSGLIGDGELRREVSHVCCAVPKGH